MAIALLALCANAPAALAQPVFTVSAPAKVKGERTGSGQFNFQGIGMPCEQLLFNGDLEGRSPTLTLVMEHYTCTYKALTGFAVDFIPEFTCKYTMRDLRPTGDGGSWEADVDFSCPGEAEGYGFEFYETREDSLNVNPLCSNWMPEQPDVGTAELRNVSDGRGEIEVSWDLPKIEYEDSSPKETGSSLVCGSPPNGIGSDLSFKATSILFAHDHQGRPVDLSVED